MSTQVDAAERLNDEELSRLKSLFHGDQHSVDTVGVRRDGDRWDAIVEVSYVIRGGENNRQRQISQTVAYFDRPSLDLPELVVRPKSNVDRLFGKLRSLIGSREVNLPRYLEFSKKFSVLSLHRDSTQALLTRPLVETLQRRPELSVITRAGRIAIVRFGQIIPEAERPEFYHSAREIVDQICESCAALPKGIKPRDAEAVEAVQQMGGMMGRMVRQNRVTAEQIDKFQAQAIPRIIPKNIARCVYGSSGFLMLWGGLALAIGATLVTCLLMSTNEDLEGDKWFVPYGLMIIPIIGGVVLFFSGRYRLARRRLLKWGARESATVVKVASTQFVVGNDTLHRVTFQTRRGEATTLVGSGHAERAQRLQASGAPVTVLVDSATPIRVLWVGGWAANTA